MSTLRRFASSVASKPYYITSPIFYVNAKPHLGHLYSMHLCDTRSRWEKLKNKESFFVTGTDEHGLKIQAVAEKRGISPKTLVDEVSLNFKHLAEKFDIQYDRFIRTTDGDHIESVKHFWKTMNERGLIYKGTHSGWYAVSDETFYPESQIEKVTDSNGISKMISKETKNEVIFHEESNYFFRLSKFRDRLINYLKENPQLITPKNKYESILAELEGEKLEDLSISRPSSRLLWGIEVPGDDTQRIYVWFDALINYITAAGYPKSLNAPTSPWPAVHVIGKDIARFHCIYWPIFLMAADLPLPKQIVIHSHWLCDGFKMSKSLGNVVDPLDTLDYYGQDACRFFLSEYSNIESDSNYSEREFHFTRENLIGKYANLVTRCGGPSFDIEESVAMLKEGSFDKIESFWEDCPYENPAAVKDAAGKLRACLDNLYPAMDTHLENFDHMKATQVWWEAIEAGNQLFQLGQPWIFTKEMKNENLQPEKRETSKLVQSFLVYMAAETCRIGSILMGPIMPHLSHKILDRLGVSMQKRTAQYASVGQDSTYGHGANDKGKKLPIERIKMRESM